MSDFVKKAAEKYGKKQERNLIEWKLTPGTIIRKTCFEGCPETFGVVNSPKASCKLKIKNNMETTISKAEEMTPALNHVLTLNRESLYRNLLSFVVKYRIWKNETWMLFRSQNLVMRSPNECRSSRKSKTK